MIRVGDGDTVQTLLDIFRKMGKNIQLTPIHPSTYKFVLGNFYDKVEHSVLDLYALEFDQAAKDIATCSACDGECESSLSGNGRKMYFALSHNYMVKALEHELRFKKPSEMKKINPIFVAKVCDNAHLRRQEALRIMMGKAS